MKIYGMPTSTCTRKVLCTLAEKAVEAQFELVNLARGEHKTPEHLERNPFGVIPALDDDGFTIYESRAIIRYLDQRFPNPPLTPTDVRECGRMNQWISVEQSYFSAPTIKLLKQTIWNPSKERDEKVIKESTAQLDHALEVLDEALATAPYLAGASFSLADISFMPYVGYLFPAGAGELVDNRTHTRAWWQRVSERPSWKKVVNK